MKIFKYLIIALKNFKVVGNFIPSQKFLIEKMVSPINKNAKCVVELGAGEGCVTRAINSKVSDDCIVLSFEINSDMVKLIKNDRKNTILINDDVQNIGKYIKKYGIKEIDYVVSSLPLAQIKKTEIDNFMRQIVKYLSKDGRYIQYQYSVISFKKLKSHYKEVNLGFTPFNFPPAFVYVCKK
ncbi:MAG: methyltransferase domain-containing protein [Candidatus Taylorbacteria bacterium]|nr:methyltransferase domain-containing protein [Candidatus Taylorbacteria bacterium]